MFLKPSTDFNEFGLKFIPLEFHRTLMSDGSNHGRVTCHFFVQNVQAGSRAHPASCRGSFLGGEQPKGQANHYSLRLIMSGAIPPSLHAFQMWTVVT
jgi:hypothetical protein